MSHNRNEKGIASVIVTPIVYKIRQKGVQFGFSGKFLKTL